MTEARGRILRPSTMTARERGGGARTIPLVTRAIGSTSFMSGITVFAPGTSIPLHFHNCEECVLLLEGHAVAEIDGLEHVVTAGEASFIPAGVPHRFINASSNEEMKIFWTYASLDATRTIVATGVTRRIEDEHRAPPAPVSPA